LELGRLLDRVLCHVTRHGDHVACDTWRRICRLLCQLT
jgi:hypothetical protein